MLKWSDEVFFNNQVDYCVGTGRLGLGLAKEYQEQLKKVQEVIGFKHIRGHGLFHEDLSIYHEYEEKGVKKVEYNFTYVDRLFDSYLELNIKPFLELGFMPKQMASGKQAIFYWQGNTTPPRDYKLWTDMLKAFLTHMINRYGEEEVLSWPIEVWNEPNLPGFWEKADMQEYFKLFKESFLAIKEVNPKFKVGGPAICGVRDEEWIKEFMEFVSKNKLNIDFVTRHHYTVEFPERKGRYDYHKLMVAENGFDNLQTTRDIVDSYKKYKGIPIHITEFNSSYSPVGVIHDTNLNAAVLAEQLSRLGDMNDSYSYWTFGDVFEEQGVPYSLFHGGFGLLANGGIEKPTFWTFAFFKNLKDKAAHAVERTANSVIVAKEDGGFAGVLWNKEHKGKKNFDLEFELPEGEYVLVTKTVDEETTNPLKAWHDMGQPMQPTKEQTEFLKETAKPFVATKRISSNGAVKEALSVKKHGIVYFEITKINPQNDRGYDYKKVISTY